MADKTEYPPLLPAGFHKMTAPEMKQIVVSDFTLSKRREGLSAAHLDWLVDSRARNQRASAKLFHLLEKYEARLKKPEYSHIVQSMVAACFSLWRSAFLADKTGKKVNVFDDAKLFLGKMLIDNAINYSQDRAAREWTFNFYMTAAEAALGLMIEKWNVLEEGFYTAGGTTYAKKRWHRSQLTLEGAVELLTEELGR